MFKNLQFLKKESALNLDINAVVAACKNMATTNTGALIVIRRTTSLDFVKSTGDVMNIEVNRPIVESVFFKNSNLHDGALIIEEDRITATRVILPVTQEKNIPLRFGLRHRACLLYTSPSPRDATLSRMPSSA